MFLRTSEEEHGADESALLDSIQATTIASLPQAQIVHRLSLVATGCGAALVLVGAATVLGWLLDVPALTSIASGASSTMKFSTALSMVASGVAVVLTGTPRHGPAAATTRAAVVLAGVVAIYVTVVLSEYVLDTSYGIDNLFGLDQAVSDDPPGRIPLATTTGLAFVSVALVLAQRGRVVAGQALAPLAGALAAMMLVAYAYGAESRYSVGPFENVAAHTAACLLLGALGVVLRHGDQGYLSLLSGNTAGGIIVRRFLPIATLVPLVAAFVVVRVEPSSAARISSGPIAVGATLVALVTAVLVWLQASRLREIDLRRAGAEDAFTIARAALRARERADQRTRAIIAASTSGYLSIDADGVVTRCNAAATLLLGLSEDQIVGRAATDLVDRVTQYDGARTELRRYLDGDAQAPVDQRYEATAVAHDGRRLTLDVTLWSVLEDGVPTFHTFLSDITRRKENEAELRRANQDLADFSAAMAHDLRTPLTVVKGFAGLIGARTDDPQKAEWVARIKAAADRGSQLIDDILDFAQVGAVEVRLSRVDLAALAAEVVEEHLAGAERAAEVDVRTTAALWADPGLLRQLLSNLVGNSLKYVPTDRPARVVIDTAVPPGTGTGTGWLVLRVSDNGDPIGDPEHIFDMFQRGAPDYRVLGNGVGLAVCRRIAELHGGRIWRETGPDGGPRFCTLLPAGPSESGAAARPTVASPAVGDSRASTLSRAGPSWSRSPPAARR
ncbi:hypothetical protein BH11ACT8_BH11ACT8_27340 [soil metagenome]